MSDDASGSTNETPVFLAPMAGITDLPFRDMALTFGAAGVVSAGFEWQSGGETWNKATALRHFLAAWLVTSRCGYGAAQGCMQTRSLLPSARKHA